MPDLLHVLDFVSVKVHHVNVIGFESLPCRWAGAPLTCMRSHKDRIRGNVLTFFVGSKRFQVISSVWNKGEQILHPFGVPFKRTNFDERLGLRGESGIGPAPLLANRPAFSCLARVEETFGDSCDRRHFLSTLSYSELR